MLCKIQNLDLYGGDLSVITQLMQYYQICNMIQTVIVKDWNDEGLSMGWLSLSDS